MNPITFLYHMYCVFYHTVYAFLEFILPEWYLAKDVSNEIVLITGAGAGLGRCISLEYANLGSDLVLWDIDEKSLRETEGLVNDIYKDKYKNTKKCYTYVVDVSKKDQIFKTGKLVFEDLNSGKQEGDKERYVSVLVNNAGIFYFKLLKDISDEQIERIISINITSHFWTIRTFLPKMMEHEHGHIVEIASIAGLVGYQKQVDYCSTKFATVGLEEALHYELDYMGYENKIRTTVVCPYYFQSTLFTDPSGNSKSLMNSEYVAKRSVGAMRCNYNRIILPIFDGYMILALRSLLPRKAQIAIGKAFGIDESVRHFKCKASQD